MIEVHFFFEFCFLTVGRILKKRTFTTSTFLACKEILVNLVAFSCSLALFVMTGSKTIQRMKQENQPLCRTRSKRMAVKGIERIIGEKKSRKSGNRHFPKLPP